MTRWGILGTGGIANIFATDLRLAEGAELVAVGSRTLSSATDFAGRHGISRAHGSWASLTADPDVDVIYVAVPHAFHLPAAMECMAAGKAVLCEKPMTLDLASSALLVQESRTRGTFLMEAMWMRCNPVIQEVAALVEAGEIGRVTAIHADFGLRGPFEATHRLRAPGLGGGALLDLGVYPIHFVHMLLGAPDSVLSWAHLTPEGVDETTGILFGYDTGTIAALTCSINGESRNAASITGERGRIDLPQTFFAPQGYTITRNGATETVSRPFEGRGYQFEAVEVQRCLAQGLLESPLIPSTVTLEVMSLLDTIREQINVTY